MGIDSSELISAAQAFGDNTARAERLLRGLSVEQVNWKPGPTQWSIAECLDHLGVTAGRYQPTLRAAMEVGRRRGLEATGPFAYGWFSRWFEAQLEPPPRRRFTAPPPFQPAASSGFDAAHVLKAFQEVGRGWHALIEQAQGLDLLRVRVASPVTRWVRFPVGAAFRQQAAHERRHLWQAEQVLAHAEFPRGL